MSTVEQRLRGLEATVPVRGLVLAWLRESQTRPFARFVMVEGAASRAALAARIQASVDATSRARRLSRTAGGRLHAVRVRDAAYLVSLVLELNLTLLRDAQSDLLMARLLDAEWDALVGAEHLLRRRSDEQDRALAARWAAWSAEARSFARTVLVADQGRRLLEARDLEGQEALWPELREIAVERLANARRFADPAGFIFDPTDTSPAWQDRVGTTSAAAEAWAATLREPVRAGVLAALGERAAARSILLRLFTKVAPSLAA